MLVLSEIDRLDPDNFHIFEKKALLNTNLSIAKYQTILSVSEFFEANKIEWNLLCDDEISAKLSEIKGIGRWTIDMILLYTLQRPDVFPCDDFHLKKIMIDLYELNEKVRLRTQMMQIAEHWGKQKSMAVLYLLEWKKSQKTAF